MAKYLGGDKVPSEGLKYRRRGGAIAQCLAQYPFPLWTELLHFKGGASDSEAQAGTHLWLEQTQQRAVAMADRTERSMVGGGFASGRSNFLQSDPMHGERTQNGGDEHFCTAASHGCPYNARAAGL